MFNALHLSESIMLAVNPRVTIDVIKGVLRAAKDTRQIVILELALSEMSMDKGYTGLTPSTFVERVDRAAKKVGWYGYVLHADHITVKKGTENELEKVRQEINARVNAGFSSYAIDTSFLFDRKALNVKDQLKKVLETTIQLFEFIKERMGGKQFAKEGEVGEIGITELTTAEEAIFFLEKLRERGIDLDCLAIANGSKHGVNVDAEGRIIPQLGINIERTVEISKMMKSKGFKTGIAQHGITGTPFHLIESEFPKGPINKGNIGTFWMLLVWDLLQVFDPELYKTIFDWVTEEYRKTNVPKIKTFTNYSKYGIRVFFDELENLDRELRDAIQAKTYAETLMIFRAFGMRQTAKKVYDYIIKEEIDY